MAHPPGTAHGTGIRGSKRNEINEVNRRDARAQAGGGDLLAARDCGPQLVTERGKIR